MYVIIINDALIKILAYLIILFYCNLFLNLGLYVHIWNGHKEYRQQLDHKKCYSTLGAELSVRKRQVSIICHKFRKRVQSPNVDFKYSVQDWILLNLLSNIFCLQSIFKYLVSQLLLYVQYRLIVVTWNRSQNEL